VDEIGNPVRVIITAGTVNDCKKADELTANIKCDILIADRGYDTNAIVESALQNDTIIVIPPKKNRKEQRRYDKELYKLRHRVENAFELLKRWRGIATRYAKHTASFLAAVQIACIALWGRLIVDTL
jgi:transposase